VLQLKFQFLGTLIDADGSPPLLLPAPAPTGTSVGGVAMGLAGELPAVLLLLLLLLLPDGDDDRLDD
jgi:hypothetical protein